VIRSWRPTALGGSTSPKSGPPSPSASCATLCWCARCSSPPPCSLSEQRVWWPRGEGCPTFTLSGRTDLAGRRGRQRLCWRAVDPGPHRRGGQAANGSPPLSRLGVGRCCATGWAGACNARSAGLPNATRTRSTVEPRSCGHRFCKRPQAQEHTELHAMAPCLATRPGALPSNPTTPRDAYIAAGRAPKQRDAHRQSSSRQRCCGHARDLAAASCCRVRRRCRRARGSDAIPHPAHRPGRRATPHPPAPTPPRQRGDPRPQSRPPGRW
jgi:hypothetical protein